jgi:hypothetical protein
VHPLEFRVAHFILATGDIIEVQLPSAATNPTLQAGRLITRSALLEILTQPQRQNIAALHLSPTALLRTLKMRLITWI